MKKIFSVIICLLSFGLMANEVETVSYVDLDRYLGKWYEIARFEQSFQKGCTGTSAVYEKLKGGEIKVTNSCYKDSLDGKLKVATGRAWVKDQVTNAKLKVQFFLNFIRISFLSGNYWIIDLDEQNYTYAVVGDPSRKYLWILSRTKTMDETLYNEIVERAKMQGFDVTKLIKTIQ